MRLTKKGFVEWLRGLKSSDTVGYTRARTNCPLANYLALKNDSRCHVNSTWWYAEDSKETTHTHPPWARKFVEDVDIGSEGVTAKKALALLGEK